MKGCESWWGVVVRSSGMGHDGDTFDVASSGGGVRGGQVGIGFDGVEFSVG